MGDDKGVLEGGVLIIDPSYFCTRVWHCMRRPSERELWGLFNRRRLNIGQQQLELHPSGMEMYANIDIVDMHLLGPCVTKVKNCEAIFIRDDALGTASNLKTRLLATIGCLKHVPIYLVEDHEKKRSLYISE